MVLVSFDSSIGNDQHSVRRLSGSSRVVVPIGTAATTEVVPSRRILPRAKSLPTMTNHEAEVLYNTMCGIKSILKYSILNPKENTTLHSRINITHSSKERVKNKTSISSTKQKQRQKHKQNRSNCSKMRNGTIIECKNDFDDDVQRLANEIDNILSDDDDLDYDDTNCLNRSIEFHYVEIREYARTVGDNPSCSSGAPIAIDWYYDPDVRLIPVEEYETCRPPRRTAYEMVMTRNERHQLLSKEWGITQAQMASAIRTIFRIKSQRRITFNRCCGSAEKFDELVENTSRSFRKLFLGRSTSIEVAELDRQYRKAQKLRLKMWKEANVATTPNEDNGSKQIKIKTHQSGFNAKSVNPRKTPVDRFNNSNGKTSPPLYPSRVSSKAGEPIISMFEDSSSKENNRNSNGMGTMTETIHIDGSQSKSSHRNTRGIRNGVARSKSNESGTMFVENNNTYTQMCLSDPMLSFQHCQQEHGVGLLAEERDMTSLTAGSTTVNQHRWNDTREQKYSNHSIESAIPNNDRNLKQTRSSTGVVKRNNIVDIQPESAINKHSNSSRTSKKIQAYPVLKNNSTSINNNDNNNIQVRKTPTTSAGRLTYEVAKLDNRMCSGISFYQDTPEDYCNTLAEL